jgi:hypothetical protein
LRLSSTIERSYPAPGSNAMIVSRALGALSVACAIDTSLDLLPLLADAVEVQADGTTLKVTL